MSWTIKEYNKFTKLVGNPSYLQDADPSTSVIDFPNGTIYQYNTSNDYIERSTFVDGVFLYTPVEINNKYNNTSDGYDGGVVGSSKLFLFEHSSPFTFTAFDKNDVSVASLPISIGVSTYTNKHYVAGFIWAIGTDSNIYKINETTNSVEVISLDYRSFGLAMIHDPSSNSVLLECELGVLQISLADNSNTLHPLTGRGIPHRRDDGQVGVLTSLGKYVVLNISTGLVTDMGMDLPILIDSSFTKISGNGKHLTYIGYNKLKYNLNKNQPPDNVLFDTTQIPSSPSDTKYLMVGTDYSIRYNPTASGFSESYNVFGNDNLFNQERVSFVSGSYGGMEFVNDDILMFFTWANEGSQQYYRGDILTLDKPNNIISVRSNLISFNTQCSFDGIGV